jgi:hypothetical protein
MACWSRWTFVASLLSSLGYALYAYLSGPEVVAVHYGTLGLPDRWGSRTELLAIQVGLAALCSTLLLVPLLFRRLPPSLLNLPHKEHWLSPEHRGKATAKVALWANTLGTAAGLVLLALQVSLPASGAPAAPSVLPSLLALALVLFTLGSSLWLALAFRLPEPSAGGQRP